MGWRRRPGQGEDREHQRGLKKSHTQERQLSGTWIRRFEEGIKHRTKPTDAGMQKLAGATRTLHDEGGYGTCSWNDKPVLWFTFSRRDMKAAWVLAFDPEEAASPLIWVQGICESRNCPVARPCVMTAAGTVQDVKFEDSLSSGQPSSTTNADNSKGAVSIF